MVTQTFAIDVQPLTATQEHVLRIGLSPRFAQGRTPFLAGGAMPAGRHEVSDDVIARTQGGDTWADFDDFPGGFVPQDQRQTAWSITIDDGQVRMAESRHPDLDQHFAFAGRIELDLLDLDRKTLRVRGGPPHVSQYCGTNFHLGSSCR